MKRLILFIIALAGIARFERSTLNLQLGAALHAQVTVEARIDSLQMLVGQQTGITIDVSCDAKAMVELPVFQKGQQMAPQGYVLDGTPKSVKIRSGAAQTCAVHGGQHTGNQPEAGKKQYERKPEERKIETERKPEEKRSETQKTEKKNAGRKATGK